jgi:RNA polymerase sigma-B factor
MASTVATRPAIPHLPLPRAYAGVRGEDKATGRRHEQRLFVRYQRDGDVAAREELVERFLPLARELANRYRYTDQPIDDLVQVASLGLIKAIDRFEPQRGTSFPSYAVPTILGELKRHFRDAGWALHVPRAVQERALAVSRKFEDLSTSLGRSPSVREVASALKCSVEEVLEAREAATVYDTAALDAPVGSDDSDEGRTLAESLGGEDARFELVELGQAVAPTVRALPIRERRILELRFIEDLTQKEIGERLGISQMHVSRLLRRALSKIEVAAGREDASPVPRAA